MKKYLVALMVGDINGYPRLENLDIMEANGTVEACEKYNEKHDCRRVCGTCIGEYNEVDGTVAVPIYYFRRLANK